MHWNSCHAFQPALANPFKEHMPHINQQYGGMSNASLHGIGLTTKLFAKLDSSGMALFCMYWYDNGTPSCQKSIQMMPSNQLVLG